MKTEITYIYALFDLSEPDLIRYVGKSKNPKRRLTTHRCNSKNETTYKANWIKSINGKIGYTVLKVCRLSEFIIHETYFIKFYKSDKLTNSDETGQGNTKRRREIIESSSKKISKIVYQYDLDGNFLAEFPSVREASRQLFIDHSQIVRTCNEKAKHANGFIFSYEKNKNIEKIKTPNAVKKQIIELDSNGIEINRWNSLMDCSRNTKIDNGCLSRVCNNKLKHIKGRFFKFS